MASACKVDAYICDLKVYIRLSVSVLSFSGVCDGPWHRHNVQTDSLVAQISAIIYFLDATPTSHIINLNRDDTRMIDCCACGLVFSWPVSKTSRVIVWGASMTKCRWILILRVHDLVKNTVFLNSNTVNTHPLYVF